MYLLGYDIGSSSVKACLVEAESGKIAASDYSPKTEMPIYAERPGWAEQDPKMWWEHLKQAHHAVMRKSGVRAKQTINTFRLPKILERNRDNKITPNKVMTCPTILNKLKPTAKTSPV